MKFEMMNADDARALAENNKNAQEALNKVFEAIKKTALENGFECSLVCSDIHYNPNVVKQVKSLLEKEKFQVAFKMRRVADFRGEDYDANHLEISW